MAKSASHELPDLYWDKVASQWRDGQGPSHRIWRAYSDSLNIDLLSRWFPKGKTGRVLKTDLFDEAVSAGLYPFLMSKAEHLTGIDLSPVTAGRARKQCPGLEVVVSDVRATPFKDGTFDVIVSNSTLDHFESREEITKALRELYRVLRPGGELLLTLDNGQNPVIAFRNALPFSILNRMGILPYYVGATLGPRRLSKLLTELQFHVSEVRAVLHCPRAPAVFAASLLEKSSNRRVQKGFLNFLAAFEHLSSLPTRFFTGHFVAVRAVK